MKKLLLFSLLSMCCQAYQIGDGSKHLFSQKELESLSVRQVRLMKNDIFALQGYRFTDKALATYYERQPWYKPIEDNKLIKLTELEQKNVSLLQTRLDWLERRNKQIIEHLFQLRELDIQDAGESLQMKFEMDTFEPFQQLIFQIDYSALANSGYSALERDDGDIRLSYEAKIEGEGLNLSFHRNVSQAKGALKLSEDEEWAVSWQFKLDNGKLRLVKVDFAG